MTAAPCRYLNSYQYYQPEKDAQSEKFDFPNEELSAIAQVYSQFASDGVDRWHDKTVEWLMVYIVTEIASTPHSMRSGYSVATILDAYDFTASKLVSSTVRTV